MEQPKLKVTKARTKDLIPYVNNAKIHTAEQIDQIAASIEQFGFSDPVGVWTRPDGQLEIVEGHGRVLAANLLGMETVPIIKLDHLDDDGRRAYVHVHNQTTLSSGFDLSILELDMESIPGFEWEDFGFNTVDFDMNSIFSADPKPETAEEGDPEQSKTVTCPYCGQEFEV